MSYYDIPDHTIIQNMEQTGYPDGKEPEYPSCPICGKECEILYTSKRDGTVVGCDSCLSSHDAWERKECYHRKE